MRAALPWRMLCLCLLTLALAACGGGGGESSSEGAQAATPRQASEQDSGEATGAAFSLPSSVTVPDLPDAGQTAIDASNANSGYVIAQAVSETRLKFQVKCGDMTYNYDLPSDGTPLLFPINMGSGDYLFRIMENIDGNNYAELLSTRTSVLLGSEFDPYLVPNVYCSYDEQSDCVKRAQEVVADASNEGEVVRDVCTYVAGSISYDYDKAKELSQGTGYVPNADATLAEGKGICFDYACLSAAMLRSLGLPAQVVTGYVSPDDLYHAWTMVYVDGTWQTAQFKVSPKNWSRCDVTFASTGASPYAGDGTSYTDRFVY